MVLGEARHFPEMALASATFMSSNDFVEMMAESVGDRPGAEYPDYSFHTVFLRS